MSCVCVCVCVCACVCVCVCAHALKRRQVCWVHANGRADVLSVCAEGNVCHR